MCSDSLPLLGRGAQGFSTKDGKSMNVQFQKIFMLPAAQQKVLEFPWKKAGMGCSKGMYEAYLEFREGGGLRKIPSVGKVLDSCWNYTIYMVVLSLHSKK